MPPLKVVVNGEMRALERGISVAGLLGSLELADRRVAVAINRAVVPKSRFGDTLLEDGDRVEILEAVGGG